MTFPLSSRLLAAALALAAVAAQADSLTRGTRPSTLAPQRLITAVTNAGPERLVAVGQRGHLVISKDAGASWNQVPLPLSSDLTAVQFVDPQNGFAVGHDGVVLGTTDGGSSWSKLLDGIAANALVLAQLQQLPSGVERDRLLIEAQRNVDAGPDKPFLDLYFSSPKEGFVVGAYNLIFKTLDGGKSWQSWYSRTDNTDKLFNLNVIRKHKGQLFVAGEAGLLMRLNPARQHFERLDTGYKGSFFGLLDTGEALIAHGMRGNAFISRDGGNRWNPLTTGLTNTIVGSTKSDDGGLWLADQVGTVVVSRDGGQRFQRVSLPISLPLAAIQVTPRTLVLAGIRGLRSVPLAKD